MTSKRAHTQQGGREIGSWSRLEGWVHLIGREDCLECRSQRGDVEGDGIVVGRGDWRLETDWRLTGNDRGMLKVERKRRS